MLKEVTIGLFLLISYAGSSLSHYESQSLPSQLEFLFKGGAFNGYHKTIRQKIWYVSNKSKVKGELAMDGKSRIFRPEAEKVWHEDYQCEYYRGVIIDGEDNIVERCAKMHPNYTAAFSDAEEKMSVSPLYSRQTSPDMKKKLEEYKAKKALEKKMKTTVIFDPREWNEWKYIYDSCRGNLYRFRYLNQEETSSVFLSRKGHPILGEILSRNGEADWAFYSSRIKNEYDIENLPGHKDIWKILSVANISKNKNGDSEVTINYLEFSNLTKDFKKREKTKTIVIKRKWDFYNELMDFLVEM